MTANLLPALARVLASIDAPRNFRALYALLASFCMAGLLLAILILRRRFKILSTVWFVLASRRHRVEGKNFFGKAPFL